MSSTDSSDWEIVGALVQGAANQPGRQKEFFGNNDSNCKGKTMKTTSYLATLICLLALSLNAATVTEHKEALKAPSDEQANVYWHNGMHFRTDDDRVQVKIGGRFQFDAASTNADSETDYAFPDLTIDRGEIRRVRLYADALFYEDYGAKVQVDFAYLGSQATDDFLYKDVYVDRRNIPYLGTIRIGHQFEPFSLEDETSTKYITFMERALPTLAFDPDRNTGLLIYNTPCDGRLWWGTGAFIPVVDDEPFDFNGNPGWNLSGRIAGRPWHVDETKYLHTGVSYIHKFRNESTSSGNQISFLADPESHLNAPMVNTGGLIADDIDIYNASLALIYGPLSLQAEYYDARVDQIDGSNLHFNGYYAYASYMLTGESRPYSTESASFGRLTPHNDFSLRGGGLGAWEVAARYSYLDLNDENIQGGEQSNITVGLNWYLNPNVLFRFNYVYAHVEDTNVGDSYLASGHTEIWQMSFQLDF
jgi:phosphate-selective porin OprO/OprP